MSASLCTPSGGGLRARVALARLVEPGDVDVGRWVEQVGPEEVVARVRSGSLEVRHLEAYRARLERVDVDLDLRVAASAGLRVVQPGDAEWPGPLDDLAEQRPLLLWVAGEAHLADAVRRSVAVVGARACTAYGEHVAAELGAGLADRRWTVVSGGAFGIDAAAHRGALAVDGTTVAVLACGADVAYPQAHSSLLQRVRAAGVVVSELPPGAHPTRTRFLERNRVIAALARGTVVVEAAIRSGARNTAGHADRLSRPVMAVPGPVTSAASAGCHELVRSTGAVLVTDAAEVVDVVGELGTDAAEPPRGPERPEDSLDDAGHRLLDALPARRFSPPDRLAVTAGLDARSALRGLALLAAAGLAESHNGAWRRMPTGGGAAGSR